MRNYLPNYPQKRFQIYYWYRNVSFIFLLLFSKLTLHAQEVQTEIPDSLKIPISIHQEQTQYYDSLGLLSDSAYDAMNEFKPITKLKAAAISDCSLTKMVYGYWPYWGGSTYQNFQWNLLSDLVYHSYEINATTGAAASIHDWATSAAVNKALEMDVRVSLNATLFSNHAKFLSNPTATQTFIRNMISLLKARNASGVCIDFETMASSNKALFASFMIALATQVHDSIKGSVVTIAIPSVEWSDIFDVVAMRHYVDYFVIMGYDYYYAGSAQAGPVGPLYSMTSAYNYNLNKSITNWIKKGVPKEQLILGLPYYGREWGTTSGSVPSSTVGGSSNSQSRTLKYIHDNGSGYYTLSNKRWENNSFSPYYVFSTTNGWRQCFVDDTLSIGKRLDLINQRNIAGMGIWALGYDYGYDYYWNKIKEKLSTCKVVPRTDSIFDAGGPAFNYYNNEDYTFTIAPTNVTGVSLDFKSFSTENGFDSLFIYSGKNTTSLIGAYTGTNSPGIIKSTGDALTLRVKTDGATTAPGWKAIWTSITTTMLDDFEIGAGHFTKAPIYNGIISFPCSEPRQTTFTSKNGNGSLEVRLLDLGMFDRNTPKTCEPQSHSLDWDVRLLSGNGEPANNTLLTGNGTISFWLKTLDVDTGTVVKLWVDDVDGVEESQCIRIINDGEWHYYIWDLSRFSGKTVSTGNGYIDGDTVTLNSIVFSRPYIMHNRDEHSIWGWYTSMFHRKHVEKWTLYIDDVMHDRDVVIPAIKTGIPMIAQSGSDIIEDNLEVVLYPNPNKGQFTINFRNGEVSRFSVDVLNSEGVKVFSGQYNDSNQLIDVGTLPEGLYVINLYIGSGVKSVKMLIN